MILKLKQNSHKAFTLIELLVVIAIIALLASIVLVALGSARVKSRDAKRVADLTAVNNALELYYSDNGHYPNTNNNWTSFDSPAYSGNPVFGPDAANLTAALVPTYLAAGPSDPKSLGGDSGYLYNSNGIDYLLIAYRTPENMNDFQNTVIDYNRCGTISNGQCSNQNVIGFWTPGGAGY
jgi:prepilin-type N-terminal cleavage/methylation domain-containing protein